MVHPQPGSRRLPACRRWAPPLLPALSPPSAKVAGLAQPTYDERLPSGELDPVRRSGLADALEEGWRRQARKAPPRGGTPYNLHSAHWLSPYWLHFRSWDVVK